MTHTENTKKALPDVFEGFFSLGKNGIGYVRNKEYDGVIQIPSHKHNTALNRDLVRVRIDNRSEGTGIVEEVLRRSKSAFSGTLVKKDDYYQLSPSDHRDPEIIIPFDTLEDAPGPHMKVMVKIDRFGSQGPIGHMYRIIGPVGENDTEMMSLALERGFDDQFPEDVEEEALASRERGITDSDIKDRKDMRGVLTFTIDPEDAKDFDDALSYRTLDNGNTEIGIHIADVSHYVRPGSAMEREAQERTTSVYLVDRTIPMLPEIISNDLCSLRPNEEKLAYSAIFELDDAGNVIEEWFGRTIIESDKRFTYEEAQEIIDAREGIHVDALLHMDAMSKKMTERRIKEGALLMESTEVKFVLDDDGTPLRIIKKTPIDTNKLIEEYMLLANRRVARFMAEKTQKSIFVYRVHDKPDIERVHELRNFLKSIGYTLPIKDGVIPSSDLNALVREIDDSDLKKSIQTAIIRSMSKAIYSTTNVGHYGLGFTYYTHFTSPIRRYPDVMVHRLVTKCLAGEVVDREDFEEYERMVRRSSEREKDAQHAEWDSIAYKQVEYMGQHIGEIFKGTITGMNSRGVYVTEEETQSSGMVRLRDVPGDFWEFDDEKYMLKGRKTKKEYHIGDHVTIKVHSTDLEKGFINYLIMPK